MYSGNVRIDLSWRQRLTVLFVSLVMVLGQTVGIATADDHGGPPVDCVDEFTIDATTQDLDDCEDLCEDLFEADTTIPVECILCPPGTAQSTVPTDPCYEPDPCLPNGPTATGGLLPPECCENGQALVGCPPDPCTIIYSDTQLPPECCDVFPLHPDCIEEDPCVVFQGATNDQQVPPECCDVFPQSPSCFDPCDILLGNTAENIVIPPECCDVFPLAPSCFDPCSVVVYGGPNGLRDLPYECFEFDIDVTPESAENPVGEEHTFTVHLTKTPILNGPATTLNGPPVLDVSGATVTLDWDGPGSVPATCTTDGDGKCYVDVNSNSPAAGTLEATYSWEWSSTWFSVSDSGYKRWVRTEPDPEYRLTITPQNDKNDLSDPEHDFTVLLEKKVGDDWKPVDDETITGLWNRHTAETSRILGPDTCVTNDAGKCKIRVTSEDEGYGKLGAKATIERDDAPDIVVRDTDHARKTWVSHRVMATPDAHNLVGERHTFTLTVQRTFDGKTWTTVDVEPATVFLDWRGTGRIVSGEECEVNVPSQEGECEVVVDSANPGTGTLVFEQLTVRLSGKDVKIGRGDLEVGQWGPDRDPVTKTWHAFRVIGDDDATNLVNEDHTFTIGVEYDGDGEGWRDAPDGTQLDVEWEGVGSIVEDGTTCIDEGTEDGTCTVKVTSDGQSGSGTLTVTAIDNPFPKLLVGREDLPSGDVSMTKTWRRPSTPPTTPPPAPQPDPEPAIALTKTGSSSTATVGDDVEYTYVVSNTGDTALDITLADVITIGGATVTIDLITAGDDVTLAAGESLTETFTYQVGASDLPGPVLNVATATGTTSGGETVTASDDWSVDLIEVLGEVIDREPGISVDLEALVPVDPDTGVKIVDYQPGVNGAATTFTVSQNLSNMIDYRYTVTNTGQSTLTDITAVDDVLGEIVLPVSTLEPGASTTATVTYLITEDDATAGTVVNTVTATGDDPDGEEVSATDKERVDVIRVLPSVIDRPDPAPEPEPDTLPATGADGLLLTTWATLMAAIGAAMVQGSRKVRVTPEP